MQDEAKPAKPRPPSLFDALIPLVVLAVLILGAILLFGDAAMDGPLQLALIFAALVTALVVLKNGHTWDEVAEAGREGVSSVVGAIFILFAVGALIGAWNLAGTIPTLVSYGMDIIHPDWFYPAAFLLCAMISLGIGSSWTTAGTIGVGLVGLSALVGVSAPITAGAVISGAYVGEKMSPLSETAILAAQLTGTEMQTHLRAQLWSSAPALALALLGFAILGAADGTAGVSETVIDSELSALSELFAITPWTLLPMVLLVVLSILRVPPSLAIIASAIFATLLAPLLQAEAVLRFVASPDLPMPIAFIKAGWQAMATGFEASTGLEQVDNLLSRGGMASMLPTIWLILGALVFGSLLERFGLLLRLVEPLLERARTTGALIATVVGSAIGLNLVAGDQYVAVVLPARIFGSAFRERGLASSNLSRAVADGGSVTSPLIPWNSCGAYMSAVLGIATVDYLPFCFFNIASPLVTLAIGFTGWQVLRNDGPQPASR
ncbi:Na+/H+ antiporter NhaC family protein [Devosia sediminis]|uniref:Na+/H+ antiporter NhaC n=1 Tax=Devosia sediminis TaxID=2798801 RepID=A0A934MIL8_9HYPH|nr:Na+/H+ antiporter NhaC family protein [Devosia sediminis]MBJ3786347.1 Na+/H+ antiporter NhaC [Devosia sediminis]